MSAEFNEINVSKKKALDSKGLTPRRTRVSLELTI